MHVKCRNTIFVYRSSCQIKRFIVPDDKVPWSTEYTDYNPPECTIEHGQPWEDPNICNPDFKPLWNQLDGNVDRRSHTGAYEILEKRPLNIVGRTGIKGRGCLGRWGPNHAADPIVTRWKQLEGAGNVSTNVTTGKPILQFVAIERKDCQEWAIPGGMVDPNEDVSQTLKREFCEEAINSLSLTDAQKKNLNLALGNFFKTGKEVYRGYVDDPRNTDNSWMETVVRNFHDETGKIVGKFQLCAGDDAGKVQWMDIDSKLQLYASHIDFLRSVAELHSAHW